MEVEAGIESAYRSKLAETYGYCNRFKIKLVLKEGVAMKIDLHCHTQKIKSGDPLTRNVTTELFAQKIADADVKIVAITNHNSFDHEQFIVLSTCVHDYCQVWPGVEFDIKDVSGIRWHLIIVANPKDAISFDAIIHSLIDGKNKDSITFTMREVIDSVKALDVLYIPHYHKPPAIPDEDWITFESLIPDSYRIFQETPDQRTLGVFANYQHRVIIGSDVQDWSKYENLTFAELRLPVESFEQFILMAKRDKVIVETLLGGKRVYHISASPHASVHFPLDIYQDMNVIFGPKGTGKTEILDSICRSLQCQGLNCVLYKGTNRDSDFDKILSSVDMTRNLTVLHIGTGEKELKEICDWADSSPTLFSNYVNWYETQEKNKNKSRMKITNATVIPPSSSDEFDASKNDWIAAKIISEQFRKIRMKLYLNDDEYKLLETIIKKLQTGAQDKSIREYIDIKATELANYSIEKIKQIADKNTDTKSFPSSAGFLNYAIGRMKLKKNIDKTLQYFAADTMISSRLLGTLEDKGKIYITSVYRMLCDDSVRAEFKIGIRALRTIKAKLESVANNTFQPDIAPEISELRSLFTENSISDLAPFLGLSKITTSADGQRYVPSNGEKGILLLQQKLDVDADAYLIDEPELGMGNSYIDQCIRPKLSDLAKQQKIVIVVTHNANIAVRTLPYQSTFRSHKNGTYHTYVGNPFTNKLTNIKDQTDVLSWKDESMHTLEGGQEAFYEREYIYKSGSHQC